jgi:predicted metal-dependent phosphoesterase TrpH
MPANLYSLSDSSASIGQAATLLKDIFQSVTAESCPHSLNFHMHTRCSDGQLTPENLIKQAIAIGLKELAITDHHTVDGYLKAQQRLHQLQQQRPYSTPASEFPRLWSGIEINADLLRSEVHILGYAFDLHHPAMQPYLKRHSTSGDAYQAKTVIAAIHQAGGLAVLAHPARYRQPPRDLVPTAARLGIDGIETYYAYDNPSPWRASYRQTQEIYRLATEHGLVHTCGTDTHGLSLLKRL